MVKEERTERNRTLKVGPQLDRNRRMPQQVTPEEKNKSKPGAATEWLGVS